MAGRSQTNPTSRLPKKARGFSRTRWLYRQEGRDLGPFRPNELRDLLVAGQIRPDTQIRESAGTEWQELRAVPEFGDVLHEVEREHARRAKEAEYDRNETKVRAARKLPMILGALALVAATAVGIWYGWQRLQARETATPSGYTTEMYRNLELAELPARAYLNTSGPIRWADEHIPVPRIETKRENRPTRKRTGGGGGYVQSANDLPAERAAPVRELSFEEDDGPGVGRNLSMGDIQTVKSRTVPALRNCAVAEAGRANSFPGTSVRFSIQPTGRLGGLTVGKNGRRSAAFMGCVRSALAKVSIQPFDGLGRTITVPLKVSR